MIVIVSIIRVNSHVATLDFRNTFQIVSSQRQKGKAKKNSVETPPSLILMSVTLSPPPSHCVVNSRGLKGWEDALSTNQGGWRGGTRSRNLAQNADRELVS